MTDTNIKTAIVPLSANFGRTSAVFVQHKAKDQVAASCVIMTNTTAADNSNSHTSAPITLSPVLAASPTLYLGSAIATVKGMFASFVAANNLNPDDLYYGIIDWTPAASALTHVDALHTSFVRVSSYGRTAAEESALVQLQNAIPPLEKAYTATIAAEVAAKAVVEPLDGQKTVLEATITRIQGNIDSNMPNAEGADVEALRQAYDTANSDYTTRRSFITEQENKGVAVNNAINSYESAVTTLNTKTTDQETAQSEFDAAEKVWTDKQTSLIAYAADATRTRLGYLDTQTEGEVTTLQGEKSDLEGQKTTLEGDATTEGSVAHAQAAFDSASGDYQQAVDAQTAAGETVTAKKSALDTEKERVDGAEGKLTEFNENVALLNEIYRTGEPNSPFPTVTIDDLASTDEGKGVALLDFITGNRGTDFPGLVEGKDGQDADNLRYSAAENARAALRLELGPGGALKVAIDAHASAVLAKEAADGEVTTKLGLKDTAETELNNKKEERDGDATADPVVLSIAQKIAAKGQEVLDAQALKDKIADTKFANGDQNRVPANATWRVANVSVTSWGSVAGTEVTGFVFEVKNGEGEYLNGKFVGGLAGAPAPTDAQQAELDTVGAISFKTPYDNFVAKTGALDSAKGDVTSAEATVSSSSTALDNARTAQAQSYALIDVLRTGEFIPNPGTGGRPMVYTATHIDVASGNAEIGTPVPLNGAAPQASYALLEEIRNQKGAATGDKYPEWANMLQAQREKLAELLESIAEATGAETSASDAVDDALDELNAAKQALQNKVDELTPKAGSNSRPTTLHKAFSNDFYIPKARHAPKLAIETNADGTKKVTPHSRGATVYVKIINYSDMLTEDKNTDNIEFRAITRSATSGQKEYGPPVLGGQQSLSVVSGPTSDGVVELRLMDNSLTNNDVVEASI